MSSKVGSREELWESYKEIKKIYNLFKKFREELGIPVRTIFNTDATSTEVHGSEFFDTLKDVKKEKKKRP